MAVEPKDPGPIPNQGDFFSLKFLLKRKWTNGEQEQEQQQLKEFPWSLTDGRRQKEGEPDIFIYFLSLMQHLGPLGTTPAPPPPPTRQTLVYKIKLFPGF